MKDNQHAHEAPWGFPAKAVQAAFESSNSGLSSEEATSRLKKYGPNCIVDVPRESMWKLWLRQFRSLIVALLSGAAIISAFVGDWLEAVAIVVVIFINALIGFFTELKANRSMDALKRLSKVMVRLRRGGSMITISSEDVVPGDLVILDAGDVVPADLRIVDANLLQVDESSLTGESLPIRKKVDPVEIDSVLADRQSMLFRSAKVTAGTGAGVVTATGEQSELGKISSMVSHAGRHSTPLEKKLDKMGYRLIWVTLVLTALVAIIGISKGRDVSLMIQTAIALAVAAIPEGLPVVATIALAHGLWRMAERNALINRLSAVETLGGTSVICTDKTGTLTENQMRVTDLWVAGESASRPLDDDCRRHKSLRTGALCNNAQCQKNEEASVGDPLEVALLEGAEKGGVITEELAIRFQREREVPFDAESRMMATIHQDGEGGFFVAAKGAPEAIISHCSSFSESSDHANTDSELWQKRNEEMAGQGLRVIAIAGKTVKDPDEQPLSDLVFYGLIGLMDPPRVDVPDSIRECKEAGVRIVMVTGDQAATAKAIAEEIGLDSDEVLTGTQIEGLDFSNPDDRKRILTTSVIARATPGQKLRLVEMFQEDGQIVAMTGDGVNDAPALKQADIGIAMGLRGTDVAREAAAMVLRDDSFPSIVAAIKQGRAIFANIRKFVAYLISCNVSEILVVGLATLFTSVIPLLPLQILYLNLVTDVFPALALGVTRAHGNILANPPRKKGEPILRSHDWFLVGWHALTIAGATLGAFFFAIFKLNQTPAEAITISFLTMAIAQLLHVFNMAGFAESFFTSTIVKNKFVWGALVLCVGLLILACSHPTISEVLALRLPSITEWIAIAGFASVPVIVELIRRSILRIRIAKR